MQVKIRENSWIAKMAAIKLRSAKVAIVIGNTIHLHNTKREEFLRNKSWVCHELKHVQQYRQEGLAGFIFKYLMESVKHGYYNNRFEKEARGCEEDENLLKDVEFI
jgi:hypothetical protein